MDRQHRVRREAGGSGMVAPRRRRGKLEVVGAAALMTTNVTVVQPVGGIGSADARTV
jgi:hypothetical protein